MSSLASETFSPNHYALGKGAGQFVWQLDEEHFFPLSNSICWLLAQEKKKEIQTLPPGVT